MADWTIILLSLSQLALGFYCGYRVGYVHGWRHRNERPDV